MQMAFFMKGGGGVLSLHISLLWQGTELPRAAQHTHVTTDGSLKFLMAAMYRPICSRSRAHRCLLYLFCHQVKLIYSLLQERCLTVSNSDFFFFLLSRYSMLNSG